MSKRHDKLDKEHLNHQKQLKDCYKPFTSSEGFEILVGKNASLNDVLTFKVAKQHDFWLHVAATSGSHVVVRNPDKLDRLPKATLREAAALAIINSKSRKGGRVDVHYTKRQNVKKQRGAPRGQVQLSQYDTVKASPQDAPEGA